MRGGGGGGGGVEGMEGAGGGDGGAGWERVPRPVRSHPHTRLTSMYTSARPVRPD